VITAEEAQRAIAGGPADVLLTHDAPVGALPMVAGGRYDPFTLQSARHI
jgi:hypothetical protein